MGIEPRHVEMINADRGRPDEADAASFEKGRTDSGHGADDQRVGLADALVNEPDILILDEPTIGLDPGQIREVRALIKGLATRHTILLSSHILSEVEMTCSRVLILNKGRIVATGTPSELRERSGLPLSGAVRLEVQVPDAEAALQTLRELPHVALASLLGSVGEWSSYEITPSEGDPRTALFEEAVRRGWKLRELSARESSLEEVFTSFVTGGNTPHIVSEEKRS